MKITLFTTNCPNCKKLENLLNENNIDFTIETDVQEVIDKGFSFAPVLKVERDNDIVQYCEYVPAVKLIRAGGLQCK